MSGHPYSDQQQQLLEELLRRAAIGRAGITQQQATIELGIGRLASRVHDLRQRGWPVKDETIRVTKANGRSAHVSRYWLERGARPATSATSATPRINLSTWCPEHDVAIGDCLAQHQLELF